ncbi:VOC family protein [Haladaptatus sp. DYF46]|uniref:VOC family protein n=1 Tax=Haladaptatus sp. DYF46 TaxID=2886041 RepID=UPI001E4B6EF3|nr:VOC family protein [Haladaptatus sp. DYF46]
MNVHAIDHVNLKIPKNGIDATTTFYHDVLEFDVENRDRYEAGEKGFFSIRLTDESVIHLRPVTDFKPPSGNSFDHVAFHIEGSIDDIKARLTAHDIDIERESNPLGATGTAPAIYVRDPSGYLLEIKETGDN